MAESTTMMALGDFRFSISTAAYQQLERSNEWRWPTVERIGVAPARQFVGPGDETISLQGTIYPSFRPQKQGLAQVSEMRDVADQGEPLVMVDGNGRVWGNYCITSLKETQSVFFSDGTPRKIEFSIELGAYGIYNPMTRLIPGTDEVQTIESIEAAPPPNGQVDDLTSFTPPESFDGQ